MPVFYFLVVIGLVLLWLFLSSVYRPLGRLAHRIWKDARDNMSDQPETPAASGEDNPTNDSTKNEGEKINV